MTVKELLVQIRPLLTTHEWATLWGAGYATKLRIDIKHNHTFHSVGEFTGKRDFENSDYTMLEPFKTAYYHGYEYGKPVELSVLDMEVYRWKLDRDEADDKLWNMSIETKQG